MVYIVRIALVKLQIPINFRFEDEQGKRNVHINTIQIKLKKKPKCYLKKHLERHMFLRC